MTDGEPPEREDTPGDADDSLAHIRNDLPTEIHGCLVEVAGRAMYSITSRGPLRGKYETYFFSDEGDHARVKLASKSGLLGERDVGGVGPYRHTQVLKKLGFRTVGRTGQRNLPLW